MRKNMKGEVSLLKNGSFVCKSDNQIVYTGKNWIAERTFISATMSFPQRQRIDRLHLGTSSTGTSSSQTDVISSVANGSIIRTNDESDSTADALYSVTNTRLAVKEALTNSETTIDIADAYLLPYAATSDANSYYFARIYNPELLNNDEIVRVKNNPGTGTLTVDRGQQSTTSRAWNMVEGSNSEKTRIKYEGNINTYLFEDTYSGGAAQNIKEAALMASHQNSGFQTIRYAVSRVVFGTEFNRESGDSITLVWNLFID